MTELKKLDTFTIRDEFSWSRQQILSEANEMAVEHAELMGWEGVEIKDITETPTKNGSYLCYDFEIWGRGISNLETDNNENGSSSYIDSPPSQVAQQTEL